jgi:acetylornithine deacetylase/succinyl-diaminopimelate desuccinylase-like protein
MVAAFLTALTTSAAAQDSTIDFSTLRDETAQRLSEYLRINTSNPPGNELATARWLKEVLAREGIEGQILDTAELGLGRANFYARVKGDGSSKAIALVHHMDVVPVTRQSCRSWLLSEPERNALLRNTISPTVLVGSNKTNTIPAEASAELDIRLLPDQDTLAFRRELLKVIADTAFLYPSSATYPDDSRPHSIPTCPELSSGLASACCPGSRSPPP